MNIMLLLSFFDRPALPELLQVKLIQPGCKFEARLFHGMDAVSVA